MKRQIKIREFCPHCKQYSLQRLRRSYPYSETQGAMWDRDSEDAYDGAAVYFVFTCEMCTQVLLYHTRDVWDLGNFEAVFDDYIGATYSLNFEDYCKAYDRAVDLMWPQRDMKTVLDQSIPKEVAECYEEALRVRDSSPLAFAGQIGRALEAICNDKGVQGQNLGPRLRQLAQQGVLPPIIAEISDELRELRNTAAHAKGYSVSRGQVQAIDKFFHIVIQYVSIAPSELAEFRNRFKANKTEQNIIDDRNIH
jgi:hypothetical protein